MIYLFRFVIACFVFIAVAGSAVRARDVNTADSIYEAYHQVALREFPESATFNGDHRYDTL